MGYKTKGILLVEYECEEGNLENPVLREYFVKELSLAIKEAGCIMSSFYPSLQIRIKRTNQP